MPLRLLLSAVLVGLLIYIVDHTIKIQDLINIILTFPVKYLAVLFFISISISVLKAWRFFIILHNSDIKMSFLRTARVFLASQAITPLPGGESMRGILVHKETGVKISKTIGPVITQAYMELLAAAILGFLGSFVFSSLRLPMTIFLILMGILIFVLINKKILKFLRIKLGALKILNKPLDGLLHSRKNILSHLIDRETKLPDKIFVRALFLSLLSNVLSGILLFIIARAYNVDLDFLQAIFISSTGSLIQIIGFISPGGLGFTEGGMTGLLLGFKVPLGSAIGVVLLYRIMTLVLSVVLGLLLLVIFYTKVLLFKKHA